MEDWEHVLNFEVAENLYARSAAECRARWEEHEKPGARRKWTRDCDAKLLRAVTLVGNRDWDAVADSVNHTHRDHVSGTMSGIPTEHSNMIDAKRSAFQCFVRYQRALNKNHINSAAWSIVEDCRLRRAVSSLGQGHWVCAADIVGGRRTAAQCRERWKKLGSSGNMTNGGSDNSVEGKRKREKWSAQADCALRLAVIACGGLETDATRRGGRIPWNATASCLPEQRSGRQCAERWRVIAAHKRNGKQAALSANSNDILEFSARSLWNASDDDALRAAVAAMGGAGRWRSVADLLPSGKYDRRQCRDRWEAISGEDGRKRKRIRCMQKEVLPLRRGAPMPGETTMGTKSLLTVMDTVNVLRSTMEEAVNSTVTTM